MVEIELTKGLTALISDADLERVQQYNWCAHSAGYAVAHINGETVYLHRFIMNAEKGQIIDHINGNKLDCRRENMRVVTGGQNQHNSYKRVAGTSIYKGVNFFKPTGKWMARIRFNYKVHYLGYFETEEDAARAYDTKARELHGEYARLNFPNEGENSAHD